MGEVAAVATIIGLVSASIDLIKTANEIYQAVKDKSQLPEKLRKVSEQLPAVQRALKSAEAQHESDSLSDDIWKAAEPDLKRCNEACKKLEELFKKAFPDADANGFRRLVQSARTIIGDKGEKAQKLLSEILDSLNTLATIHVITNTKQLATIKGALDELKDDGISKYHHSGSGHQNVNEGSGTFNQTSFTGEGHQQINAGTYHAAPVTTNNIFNDPDELQISYFDTATADYRDLKNLNPKPAKYTCKWVFGHETFRRFKQDKSPLLWLSGDPGCGKSVISRALVDDDGCIGSECIRLYFFFKDSSGQKSVNQALCALLHQVFKLDTRLLTRYAQPIYKANKDLKSNFNALWDLFIVSANKLRAKRIVCVLDALDECEINDRNKLIRALSAFLQHHQTGNDSVGTNLRFFVTSRPYRDIEDEFNDVNMDDFPSIRLAGEQRLDAIRDDVKAVIMLDARRMLHKQLSEPVLEYVVSALLAMDNQTYIWPKLMLDEIRRSRKFTRAELDVVINELPRTVDDAYERILSRVLQSDNLSEARKVLQILVVAERPLSWYEMKLALSIDDKTYSYKKLQQQLVDAGAQAVQDHFRELCGLFITIKDSKLYLYHQTAKDFLVKKGRRFKRRTFQEHFTAVQELSTAISQWMLCVAYKKTFQYGYLYWEPPLQFSESTSTDTNGQNNNSVWKQSMDVEASNRLLAAICLKFLFLSTTTEGFSPEQYTHWADETSDYFPMHEFLSYSARFKKHLRNAQVGKFDKLAIMECQIDDVFGDESTRRFRLHVFDDVRTLAPSAAEWRIRRRHGRIASIQGLIFMFSFVGSPVTWYLIWKLYRFYFP